MGNLTDALIAAAPLGAVLTDGEGLRLRIGSRARTWQLKRAGTTETLGTWPAMSINKARAAAEDRREAPAPTVGQPKPRAAQAPAVITLAQVGNEYIAHARGRDNGPPSAKTLVRRRWLFDKLAKLHGRALTALTRADILPLLEAIQAEGKHCTAKDVLALAAAIFDHAQRHGIDYNPCARTRGWLVPYRAEHHPAVTDPLEFGRLAYWVDTWHIGEAGTVENATKLLMRTVVRPGELRSATWDEFHDLDKPELARWELAGSKMKMGKPHVVPLSAGALAVLAAQAKISPPAKGAFVFPNSRVPGEPMNADSMASYLERCGYSRDRMVPHGFRRSFGTLARRGRQQDAVVEACLAHADRNAVRAAYNEWQFIDERRELLTWWDLHIETLKAGSV